MAFDDFVRTELGRSSRRDSSSSSSVAATSKGEPKPFGVHIRTPRRQAVSEPVVEGTRSSEPSSAPRCWSAPIGEI